MVVVAVVLWQCGSVYYPGPVLPGGASAQLSPDWREENK